MEDKKAVDVEVMDLGGKTLMADYFILCTGTSRAHVHAIVDGVAEAMKEHGIRGGRREGYTQARWVLLDYGDVIVHIFAEDERKFYDLESLWRGTADRLSLQPTEHEPSDSSAGLEALDGRNDSR